jgi:hypothetical protein
MFPCPRDMDRPVPWWYLWVVRCNDHEVLVNYVPSFPLDVLSLGCRSGPGLRFRSCARTSVDNFLSFVLGQAVLVSREGGKLET